MSLAKIEQTTADWRGITHKLHDEGVMVIDVEPPSGGRPLAPGDRCTVELSLQRRGCMRTSPAAQSPTLLALEAFRQAGIATAHVCGSAAIGVTMLANSIRLQWCRVPVRPLTRAWCSIIVTGAEYRRGRLQRLQIDAEISDDTVVLAHGHGDLTCVPHPVYARMRRGSVMSEPAGLRPSSLSDTTVTDGVLTATTAWDTSDPLIFDHPLDHVPGMHFALAALRAHAVLRGSRWNADCGIDLEFTTLAELDAELSVSARGDGGGTVVTFQQLGRTVASARCPDTGSGDAGTGIAELAMAR